MTSIRVVFVRGSLCRWFPKRDWRLWNFHDRLPPPDSLCSYSSCCLFTPCKHKGVGKFYTLCIYLFLGWTWTSQKEIRSNLRSSMGTPCSFKHCSEMFQKHLGIASQWSNIELTHPKRGLWKFFMIHLGWPSKRIISTYFAGFLNSSKSKKKTQSANTGCFGYHTSIHSWGL